MSNRINEKLYLPSCLVPFIHGTLDFFNVFSGALSYIRQFNIQINPAYSTHNQNKEEVCGCIAPDLLHHDLRKLASKLLAFHRQNAEINQRTSTGIELAWYMNRPRHCSELVTITARVSYSPPPRHGSMFSLNPYCKTPLECFVELLCVRARGEC